MSTHLEELCLEGRLGAAYWRILVYVWQRHLDGDSSSTLRALGYSAASLQRYTEHLAMRKLLNETVEGGRFYLSPVGRQAFGLPPLSGMPPPIQPGKPDTRHAFNQRDRETQRLALSVWWDTGNRRDLVKQAHEHWRNGTLNKCPAELLNTAERFAAQLPALFPEEAT